jgi:hypothetical protein
MAGYTHLAASVSSCGAYRYGLSRRWDEALPVITFVMLNPSTADAVRDDRTIAKCAGFARRESMGGMEVVNLFALRATYPSMLKAATDPKGPDNSAWLEKQLAAAAKGETRIVCAWGATRLAIPEGARFADMAALHGVDLYCLGQTRDGHPRHPLYLPAIQPLERWR